MIERILTKADILRPLYHAREITAGLDVLTDAEITGTFFDEGILFWVMLFSKSFM